MNRTSKLFLFNRLFNAPLEALFTLLTFFICKDLPILPLQLTLFASLKPLSSLLSFWINSFIIEKPHRTRLFLVANSLVGALPCLFYLFIDSVWFFLLSYVFFLVQTRAVYPTWMELLRRENDPVSLDKAVCWGVRLNYAIGMVIPPIACLFLDQGLMSWRILFTLVALLYLCHLFVIVQLPNPQKSNHVYPKVNPLTQGWKLLSTQKDFTHYLILFVLTGAGIVASQGMLPLYFKNELNLSYTELGLAISFCKGLAFTLSSPIWNRLTKRISLLHLNCYAALFTALYFLFLLFAPLAISSLFIAYLAYGTMQGGNELSWNLSGPLFSRDKESTLYSSMNLLVAGIRGSLFPFLGCLIYEIAGAIPLFSLALAITLSGVIFGFWIEQKNKHPQEIV